jgi:hypothetical protein
MSSSRTVALATAGLVVLLVVGNAPAATTIAPPTGIIRCGLTGKLSFKPALPNANLDTTPRTTRVKLQATLGPCDASQVVGGAAPITGGTLALSGTLDTDASCFDLAFGDPPDPTWFPSKVSVKWTATRADGRQQTVGRGRSDILGTGDTLFGGWEYLADPFRDDDAFAAESATIDLGIANLLDVNGCVRGWTNVDGKPVNLTAVQFTATQGSSITVAP